MTTIPACKRHRVISLTYSCPFKGRTIVMFFPSGFVFRKEGNRGDIIEKVCLSTMASLVTQSNSVSIRPRFRLDLDMEKVYFEPMERYGSILKLSQADEEKELEFELNYLASLTFEERLKMMKQKSREMLRQMVSMDTEDLLRFLNAH